MASEYKTAIYTHEQVENARTKGQLVGWVQGGLAVGGLLFLLQFIGWIPLIGVAGLVLFAGYRFTQRKK
ncbi:MAG: hypothetical protein O3A57_04445 [Bacteroidetes bacterium]|nr:hypothetical protein [Bacteroidota bacterium]